MYPDELIELRHGARVIERSKIEAPDRDRPTGRK
jgi:hypothetical protein